MSERIGIVTGGGDCPGLNWRIGEDYVTAVKKD